MAGIGANGNCELLALVLQWLAEGGRFLHSSWVQPTEALPDRTEVICAPGCATQGPSG